MKNILMLCPSLYGSNFKELQYQCSRYTGAELFTAVHTNVPIFNMLTSYLSKQNERVDRVIMLASPECRNDQKATELGEMNTIEYLQRKYADIVLKTYDSESSEQGLEPEYRIITIGNDEINDRVSIQNSLNQAIYGLFEEGQARIWVDFTSGLRSYAMLLVFLTRFLETERHYEVEDVLYANILRGEAVSTIDSCMPVYEMFSNYAYLPPVSAETPTTPQEEIDWLIRNFRDTVMNDPSDHTELLRETRNKVLVILGTHQGDAMIAAQAQRILDSLPSHADELAQYEYMLHENLVSSAILRLREKSIRFLIDKGVFSAAPGGEPYRNIGHIELELISAWFYYESYLAFLSRYVARLQSDLLLNPVEELRRQIAGSFNAHYADHYEPWVDMSNYIYEKDYSLFCMKYLGMVSPDVRDKQIFLRAGFPFACMDYKNHSYSFTAYAEHFRQKADLLAELLSASQMGTRTHGMTYEELLNHVLELSKMNYQLYGVGVDNLKTDCPPEKQSDLQNLLRDFVQLHIRIKDQRDSYAHTGHLDHTVAHLNPEERKNLAQDYINVLRNMAALMPPENGGGAGCS